MRVDTLLLRMQLPEPCYSLIVRKGIKKGGGVPLSSCILPHLGVQVRGAVLPELRQWTPAYSQHVCPACDPCCIPHRLFNSAQPSPPAFATQITPGP